MTTPPPATDAVTRVRAFNRFYTGVIGLLSEGHLHTPHTLTEARVLFELAQSQDAAVADLRQSLGLDPGYLSRLLARFETDGLVTRRRAADDGRRQVVALTDAGRDSWRTLDRRSAGEVAKLLAPLSEADRRRLLGAMGAIRELLGAPEPTADPLVLRQPLPGDLGWIVQRHGAVYARDFGFDATFEAFVARIVADYAQGADPRREAAWVAELDGAPVGCVLCVRADDTTAKLRVLLVEPAARGRGLGSRLVAECLRFAEQVGYTRIVLFTYDVCGDARRIYQRAGFQLAEQRPIRAHGHDLVEQTWSRPLGAPATP
ncbi:MAG TPA: helix-turn-helix domain-containing GNAT family N-acetyltransferase [Pilimelia sp.]|nr:helix-turn-helix domain-containing GNAT family N-acetyltransferase [Pilimelia sp.]